MESINVLFIDFSRELAKKIAKRHGESDISLYGVKEGEKILTLCEPSSYPEKMQSLLNCIALCTHAVLVARSLGKELAECIVALDLAQLPGFIVYSGVSKEELAPFVKGTIVERYEEISEDPIEIREKLLGIESRKSEGKKKALIDSCFAVKGVGTVALGVVLSGDLKVHDSLLLEPTGKRTEIRSIQMHDEDVKESPCNSRFGASLKGVEPEDSGRGNYLCEEGALKKGKELSLEIFVSKFKKGGLTPGKTVHVWEGMQSSPALVKEGEIPAGGKGKVKLELQKEIAYSSDSLFFICDYEGAPRVFGAGKLSF